ncbi:rhombosortase [Wenzhouxiangella sp. XN24]|uniref:rhombosortase n=1 Tax=Wenzhouxiangella sp. XN24 TaxID=2713569 RepID=UPI0013E9A76B|nr:rhombosortase [Wenzhouxiangella sp. XN24]NGX15646.1 rhombosortase [Wenzhouxiangella sp. XN24]
MSSSGRTAGRAAWIVSLLLLAVAVLFQALDAGGALRWERGLLLTEPWRIVTSHLVHLGWTHLGLNVLAAAMLGVAIGRAMPPGGWLWSAAVSVVAVSGGLATWSSGVQWYMGFSGVLHGLLAAGAIAGLRSTPWVSGFLLLVLAGKLAFERFAMDGSPVSLLIGGAVVTDAHLYGALGGALAGLVMLVRERRRSDGAGTTGFG